MKREEIEGLEAGRALDSLVAEKVLGWRWLQDWYWTPETGTVLQRHLVPPDYPIEDEVWATGEEEIEDGATLIDYSPFSEDMGHAWQVWAHFGEDLAFAEALCKVLHIRECSYSTSGTVCLVLRELSPLAICLAALLAVHVGQEEKRE